MNMQKVWLPCYSDFSKWHFKVDLLSIFACDLHAIRRGWPKFVPTWKYTCVNTSRQHRLLYYFRDDLSVYVLKAALQQLQVDCTDSNITTLSCNETIKTK